MKTKGLTQTRKFVVKQDMPFDRIKIVAGTIITMTSGDDGTTYKMTNNGMEHDNPTVNEYLNSIFSLMSISNKDYFLPMTEVNFSVGDEVFDTREDRVKILIVDKIDYVKGTATVHNVDNKYASYSPKLGNLKKANRFWFINTDGRVQWNWQETIPRKYQVCLAMGNCYETRDDAYITYNKIMDSIVTTFGKDYRLDQPIQKK